MKKILPILFFYMIGLTGLSQNYKSIAPSPQAYAFAQYAEMPVSLYTGTPSINIPLFTIPCGQYSLPISLSYHASGIKVTQEASWVGLGWNLNVGGSISRSVRGRDDLSSGYFEQDKLIPPVWDNDNYDEDILHINPGLWLGPPTLMVDTEPDVFYYNFLGYSGKFYCKNRGAYAADGKGFYLVNPDDNLKITFLWPNFEITTPDGTIAQFIASENSKPYNVSFDEFKSGEYINTAYDYQGTSTVTNWELGRIIFPNKEEIQFIYDDVHNPFLPAVSISHSYFNCLFWVKNGRVHEGGPPLMKTYCQTNIMTFQRYLKEIRWKSGHIELITGKRDDFRKMPFTDGPLCPKLDKILFYRNGEVSPFRRTVFHESYFINPRNPDDYSCRRLKLDSISVCADMTCDIYKFGYDTRYPLPSKYSFAQDHWGYYNGVENNILYPQIEVLDTYEFVLSEKPCFEHEGVIYPLNMKYDTIIPYKKGQVLHGANRDVNPEYITTGMLTSIESPEGAITTYAYEPNEGGTKTKYDRIYLDKKVYTKVSGSAAEVEYRFSLSEKGCIELNFEYNGNSTSLQTDRFQKNLISLRNEDGAVIENLGIEYFTNVTNYDYTIKNRKIECPKGNYTLTLRSSHGSEQKVELTFYAYRPKEVPYYGGGVRIAKVISPLSTREYIYKKDDGTCSGIFMQTPFHEVFQKIEYNSYDAGTNTLLYQGELYLVQQSSPVYPLESPQSNTSIGYSKVKAISRSPERTIEEDFYYAVSKERVNMSFPGMPSEHIYMNGKLLKHITYLDGKLQQKETNVYEELVVDSLNALYQEKFVSNFLASYKIPITHCRLKSSTREVYDPQTAAVNRSVISYDYNENYLPRVVTMQSGGDTYKTQTTYPADLKGYGLMCNYHQIAIPIATKTYKNGQLSKAELHEYKKHNSLPVYVPSNEYKFFYGSDRDIEKFDGNNALYTFGFPYMTYTAYDDSGNNIEARSLTGQTAVYLWGYRRQYPVAQIFNATLEEVKAAGIDPKTFGAGDEPTPLEWIQLNGLRDRLPRASVSLFHYQPFVGVTIATDSRGINTYYEYDSMGRLMAERDHNRNLIRTYRYTLKNER